jgi:hypothetical protein
MPRPRHLAVELDGEGAHPAAWRRVRAVAQVAENAGFTLATFDDSLLPPDGVGPVGRIGAMERAAFAAVHTSVLGLAPVVSTTYSEPFHVSSQLASLDFAAAGRAAWLVATTADAAAASALDRPVVEGAALAREARNAVRVARDLWDSWEDDAAIRDVATGRYLDREKIHYIAFVGETYSVKGPAIVPRPPQGRLVVIAPAGLLPGGVADVEIVKGRTVAELRDAPSSGLRFAELEVALDTPATGAAERVADLDRHTVWPGSGRLRYAGAARRRSGRPRRAGRATRLPRGATGVRRASARDRGPGPRRRAGAGRRCGARAGADVRVRRAEGRCGARAPRAPPPRRSGRRRGRHVRR